MAQGLSRREFLRVAAVAGAGAAALLAGCQPKVVEQPSAPAAAELGAPPVQAPAGDVIIDYWNGLTGEDGITMLKICQLWQEKNEGVFVKTQRIPWGQYLEKLLPALVAGSGPDIFILHRERLPDYASKPGVLLPLDDIFDQGLLPRDDYRDEIIADAYWDGKLMGVPLDAYGPVCWINMDLLEQAGVEWPDDREPLSREEFLDLVTKCTWDESGKHPNEAGFNKDKVAVWGYAGRDTVGETTRQNGVDAVSLDGSCKATVTDPLYLDGLQFGRDLTWEYWVKPPVGVDVNMAFAAGQLVVRTNGSWYYNWFRDYPDTNWAARYWPRLGKEKGIWVGSHNHCLPGTISAVKRDWCFKLIAEMGSTHLWSAEAGMPSARMSIAEHPAVKENWALPMQFRQHAWAYRPNLTFKQREEVLGVLNPRIAAALNNEMTPLAAMQEAEREMQAILDRAGCW